MSEIQENLFWSSGNNSLIIGNSGSYTNPIDASVVLGATQLASSGLYPLKISLNQGNFFVLTKDGKVAINSPSFPVYESSPNFHMVGRCAVFEGNCGAGGVALTLYNNPDVVPQVGSTAGSLNLSARNNNRNVVNFAQVQSKILNPLKGQTRGQFVVNVESSGTSKPILKLDDSVNQIGINTVDNATYTSVLGSGNSLSYVNNSKVIGDGNNANRSNNLYLLGSDNSIDLIKNSVVYVLGYDAGESPLAGTPSDLNWGPNDDLSVGDIVKIENNALYNGYYIASTGTWTKIDNNVAVAYIGTSNILIGSENELSGNNVIAIGNSSVASGNNIFMFGSYNSIRTQKLTGILSSGNQIDNSYVLGSYNTIEASGTIVFGSHNVASGISAIVLQGSHNTIASGSMDSVLIGDDNTLSSISGIAIGSENSGTVTLGSIIGYNNDILLSNSNVYGSNNSLSGVHNNIFGNNSAISGSYISSIGQSINSVGSNNLIFGHNDILTGNSGIFIGSANSIIGDHLTVMGSNTIASGNNSIITGSHNNAANLKSSTIYGNANILRSGEYLHSNVVGHGNIVTSGIANIRVIGDNNTLNNIFNLTVDYTETFYSSEYAVKADLASSSMFRLGDTVEIKNSDELLVIENKIPDQDPTSTQFTIEFQTPIPSGLKDQTVYIKSKTLQNEITHNYSNPATIIGNENTLIGMSGLLIGNINYASGNNIFNISSASRIEGNNVINIGSKFISTSGNNIVNIGNNFNGLAENLTNLGFNNIGQYRDNSIIGSDNIVLNGDVIGSGNLIYDRNAAIFGDTNTILGFGKSVGSTNNYLFASGVYDTSLDAVVLSQNSERFYSPAGPVGEAQKLIVQLAISGAYLPAFSGYATSIRGDQMYFAKLGPNMGSIMEPIYDTFNPVPLQTFIKSLFPSVVPDNIEAFVYPITDEQKVIIGSDNTITEGHYVSIFGNDNKYGSDVLSRVTSASGLIVGSNNIVDREWFIDNRGFFNWKYPYGSTFQGAIGLDITNYDPNSIHVGHSQNTFKVFNNGGRKNRDVSEIIDPLTIPPTRQNVQKEAVGQNAFRRGVLFNNNYQSDTVVGVMSSSETNEPAIVIIPSSENRVGINTSIPQSTLDVSGSIRTNSLKAITATIDNLSIPTNAAEGYFLTSKDSTGAVEWKYGLKIDFQGLPGTLMYWSGVSLTDGKIQPMSQLVKSTKDSTTVPFNQVVYNTSGCTVTRSGLLFDQYSWCDKYSIMALDGLRRNTLAEVLSAIEDSGDVNPHQLEYVNKLLDYARAEQRAQESYYVPYSANVLYFIPELISLKYQSGRTNSIYSSVLDTAGYNREGIFAIGRRTNSMPSPINNNIEETDTAGSFAAASLPNGMVAPQNIISTIPKKNSRQKKVHYRFNRNEMKFYTEMLHKANSVINTELAAYMRPMESNGDMKGWWDASGAPDDAVVPLGNDTDLDRAVPTAFNMGLDEIDFVIYGTGSKYKSADTADVPKFIIGSESDFKAWSLDPDTPIDLPCVKQVPAFYYNASINSFMLHTMKPSWIPVPIPGDECKPCNPKESGVWFADLTVRGWIGTSGIRIGTGLTRQVEVDTEDPTKVREMVDEKGNPLFRSTRGMYLRSDAYGFGVWDEGPDGVSRSSNDIIRVPTSTETTLVEGSLDPLIDIANFPMETNDVLTSARLIRDTLAVKSDAEASSNSFRIRGITRNTLLFAQNPAPNTYYRTGKTNKFNEPPYQSDNNSLNESTIDGTENVFYYGYSNALAGLLLYNNSLQKTEIWVDGDATKRIRPGDVLRLAIYYKPENYVDGQPYPQKILKIPVLGVNTVWLSGEKTSTEKTLQTQIVLTEKLDIEPATYSLDSTNQLRQVALMSENVGGYLTFNFPGSTPELVLSNREGIPNLFNTSGKKIDFAVYGGFKTNRPDPSLFVDSTNRSVNINTAKSMVYGTYSKSLTFDSSLLPNYRSDINSPIYYDYGWQDKYVLGLVEETSSLLKITGAAPISTLNFLVGDVVEIVYDGSQKILGQIVSKTIGAATTDGSPVNWDIRISLTAINPGLVDNRIGNILRVKDTNGIETAAIVNNNVKVKIIKRQLALSTVDGANNTTQTKAEGSLPLNASLSVKGLTYTDGLMLSDKDAEGHVIVPHNSVLYNRYGMVFGSNLRFFTYNDLLVDNKKNQHLLYNTEVPAVIATGVVSSKINGNVPVFADTTLKGSTKIEQLYIDNLSSFDTIDGGQVVFGGTCNGSNLQCQ